MFYEETHECWGGKDRGFWKMKQEKGERKASYCVWRWCHSSLGYECGYYSTTQIVGFDFVGEVSYTMKM